MFKKILSLFLILTMVTGLFAGCSGNNDNSSSSGTTSSTSTSGKAESIYFLNFKPEISSFYEEIAKEYEAETGVKVQVTTAAANTYEQTLKSEIAKSDAPTIFQINGPRGYASWKDYCADVKGTQLYEHLADKSLAITSGDGAYGIPYVVEGYGIIYNNAIMEKYFALTDRATTIKSAEEINSYALLKAVAEDMTKHKDALGIKGVFASTSLKPGDDWRWQTHLANLPIYYEFDKNDVDLTDENATKEITFEFADNYKNIFDLYINNSVTEPKLLGSKQVADSMAEFALGQCAMVQNGNWAWEEIAKVSGNTVKEEDIRFLPIYIGAENEANQGLCVGTENYFAINSKVSEEKQKASADFLYWLFSSEKGKDFVTNKLGFITPFDTFEEDEKPKDPLAREVIKWMNKDGVTSVPWVFAMFPNQVFKDEFGALLLQYAQGKLTFDQVKTKVVELWKTESANAAGTPA